MLSNDFQAMSSLLVAGLFAAVTGCSTAPSTNAAGQETAHSATHSGVGVADHAPDADQFKREEIQSRLRAARELQLEQKYDEALAQIEAALFLDPQNPVLLGFRDMIRDSARVDDEPRVTREGKLEVADPKFIALEAKTPYGDILGGHAPWPELTAMRLKGLDENNDGAEANRVAQAAMQKTLSLNNDDLTLEQVISLIRDTTGANIAVNWPALELVGIDQDALVSISLREVRAEQLLDFALAKVSSDAFDNDKAGFSISDGVIKISTLFDLNTDTQTRVYDIRGLLFKAPDRAERIDELVDLVQSSVGDVDEWLDETSALTELNGNFIVKTTANNHAALNQLLDDLRSPIDPDRLRAALTELDAQQTLDKKISLNSDNLAFDGFIDFIRESTGVDIDVNWSALELVGIDQDSLVSVSLKEVPAEQLLRLVLEQVSADAFDDDKAGFTVRDGVVVVSTLRELKVQTETRVYDARDLVGRGRDRNGLVEQLTVLIQETVGNPDEWLDEESLLTALDSSLVIKTTPDNHAQVMQLLTKLRTPMDQNAVAAAIVDLDAQQQAHNPLGKAMRLDNAASSLGKVIANIRDRTGANLYVNWSALELVGIDPDTHVIGSFEKAPADQLLRAVLDKVSADAFDDDKAGFAVRDGVVIISTLRELKHATETHVYDIRDLLLRAPHREERIEQITELIQSNVGSQDEWDDMDLIVLGFKDHVIIKTSRDDQWDVLVFLTKLRLER